MQHLVCIHMIVHLPVLLSPVATSPASFPCSIFSLKALDQHVISDQEIIENMRITRRFGALCPYFKLALHITVKLVRQDHEHFVSSSVGGIVWVEPFFSSPAPP